MDATAPAVTFDPIAGAWYCQPVNARPVHRTMQLGSNVNIDLDSEGNIVGVELL